MADIFNMLDTWNASGTTFTGIKLSVTDTASAAGSLLMDLQVGGAARFNVTKAGRVKPVDYGAVDDGDLLFYRGTALTARLGGTLNAFSQSIALGLGSNSASSPVIRLEADAANTLAQRNGVNAQAFNLYNTYTDASNYERGFMRFVSNELTIGAEAAGTGTARNVTISSPATVVSGSTNVDLKQGASVIRSFGGGFYPVSTGMSLGRSGNPWTNFYASGTIILSSLPTSNPAVAGQLWNDAGTLKVSAG